MKRRIQAVQMLIVGAGLAVATAGCDDPDPPQPQTLKAPVSVVAVGGDDGQVCLPRVLRDDATIGTSPLPDCDESGNGFGLVVNQRSNLVGVVALGQDPARMVNLDARRPGISQIPVGNRPIDVAVSGDGTAAVVANQADQTLTGIDLWTLRPMEQSLPVEGTPRVVETFEGEEGQPLVAILTGSPNRLQILGGLQCERPAADIDRRDHNPDDTCEWVDSEVEALELPGRPVDMDIDADGHRARIIYRDINALSFVALSEAGFDDDDTCLDAGDVAPCEVERLSWEENDDVDSDETRWGATEVDTDPLGLMIYVLDRPNNQLLTFDRRRRTLINAAEAMEPSAIPFRTEAGIPLIRSSTSMAAEVRRTVLDDGDPAHIRYRLGARVAANDGRVYRVVAAEIECVYDGGDVPTTDAFLFDAQRRAESDEAACVEIPQFPLGGDSEFDDDEELLEHRILETEGATLAVTPIFSLRDSLQRQGQIVGRARCEQPEEFRAAMREAAARGQAIDCGSPLSPQPVSTGVDPEMDSFLDAQRADLMELARAFFDADFEPWIERSIYDFRLRSEEWSVTYEGAIPGPGDSSDGLIASDEDGRLLSGGLDYCRAGVQPGDRLTIVTSPSAGEECTVFEGEPDFRTYEIVETGPVALELATIDEGEFSQRLPTRDCFRQGLNYEIRPHQQWTVVGTRSGMTSPLEREGDQCVVRDGAQNGRLDGRVATGEEYLGPYLRFLMREGEVEAVRGLQYRFQVQRNFEPSANNIAPREGTSLPAKVLFTPDLGMGRLLVVADGGGDRLFIQNLSVDDIGNRLVR